MKGSWKGGGNQYIQSVKVLYSKVLINSKQLPAFPHEVNGWNSDLRGGRRMYYHCATVVSVLANNVSKTYGYGLICECDYYLTCCKYYLLVVLAPLLINSPFILFIHLGITENNLENLNLRYIVFLQSHQIKPKLVLLGSFENLQKQLWPLTQPVSQKQK